VPVPTERDVAPHPSNGRPPVYVVVVNYNGWADTIACVESVARSDYPDCRVIVVENGSTDDSLDHLTRWAVGSAAEWVICTRAQLEAGHPRAAGARARLVEAGTNLGFAGGVNIGLRHVLRVPRPAFALLLNNDAVVAPDAVSRLVDVALATPNVGAVGASVLRSDAPETLEMLAGARINAATGMVTPMHAGRQRNDERPAALPLHYVSGCCLLTSADAIRRVGLMDEGYFLYSEDADWGIRMRREGLTLTYSASAEVWHKGGAAVVHRSATHDYYVVRGALMLVRKLFPWLLPVALVHWAFRGVGTKLVRGQWARLRAAARGYRDFVIDWVRPGPLARRLG